MKKSRKKVVNLKESRHSLNILRGENTATSLDHLFMSIMTFSSQSYFKLLDFNFDQ